MIIEELKKLIEDLSARSNIDKSEIIDEIAEYAKLKFGDLKSENERKTIDEVKRKLIKGLYRRANHSFVSSKPDYKKEFKLDELETKYLKKAGQELEKEELIEGNDNYIKLTDNGIIKAKNINEDI